MTGSVARRERVGLGGQELRPRLHGAHPGQHHHPPQGGGEYCIQYTAVLGQYDNNYNLGELEAPLIYDVIAGGGPCT